MVMVNRHRYGVKLEDGFVICMATSYICIILGEKEERSVIGSPAACEGASKREGFETGSGGGRCPERTRKQTATAQSLGV